MGETRRRLVSLSVSACEPERGCEPGVGWAFVRVAALLAQRQEIDVIVLTRDHGLNEIRKALVDEHLYTPLIGSAVPLNIHRLMRGERVRFAYVAWQIAALRAAKRLTSKPGRLPIYYHVSFDTAALPTAGIFQPRGWTLIVSGYP